MVEFIGRRGDDSSVELILQVSKGTGFAMVFSLLVAAILLFTAREAEDEN